MQSVVLKNKKPRNNHQHDATLISNNDPFIYRPDVAISI